MSSVGRSYSGPSLAEASARSEPRRTAGRALGVTAGLRSRSAPHRSARSQGADRGRRCPGESGGTGLHAAAGAPRPQGRRSARRFAARRRAGRLRCAHSAQVERVTAAGTVILMGKWESEKRLCFFKNYIYTQRQSFEGLRSHRIRHIL